MTWLRLSGTERPLLDAFFLFCPEVPHILGHVGKPKCTTPRPNVSAGLALDLEAWGLTYMVFLPTSTSAFDGCCARNKS